MINKNIKIIIILLLFTAHIIARNPDAVGKNGMVVSSHELASQAGVDILKQGGNAIDAAAAMCFCINFLEANSNGIGGEVPTLIYSSKEKKTYAIKIPSASTNAKFLKLTRWFVLD